VLRALFLEILASQGLATLLNVCFVSSVGANIPDDNIRAGWVGNFYALINVITMMLQFGVLPLLMQYIEPKDLWRVTPLISLAFTTYQACQKNPSLYAISASLLVMKISEYSARRMLDEMVYVPLDFESRFVGKEIIGVFGYRFGKSLISLSLSGLTSIFGQFNLQSLSVLSDVVAFGWAKTAWDLSSLVPTRKEAQDSYDKQSGKKSNKRTTKS
jgi:ATP/ADP translocase